MSILKGLTFSDMHLMRERGDFRSVKGNLIRLISSYDIVFYNGDIFELFYGKHLSKEDTSLKHAQDKAAKEALKKLKKIIKATPETEHRFILGNHEDYPLFKTGLDDLAREYKNFFWDKDLMVFHDMVFLHGDLPMGGDPKQREKYLADNLHAAKIYNFINARYEPAFLKILDNTLNREAEVSKKVVAYLKEKHPESLAHARYIFIGHTHKPFKLEYEGYVIQNTGTLAVEKREFPVELEINTETGITTSHDLPSHILRYGLRSDIGAAR